MDCLCRKLRDYMASEYTPLMETKISELFKEGLINENDTQEIRQKKQTGKPAIKPSKWLYWNVHVDGLEKTHDMVVERKGVFKECKRCNQDGKETRFKSPPTPQFISKRI